MLRILFRRMLHGVLYSTKYNSNNDSVDEVLYTYWKQNLCNSREYLLACALDKNDNIKKISCLSIGNRIHVPFPPLKFIWFLIFNNANSLYLAHNHPNNNLEPSKGDRLITKEIDRRCNILGVRLIDHLVFTKEGKYSIIQDSVIL